jgi:phosphoribosylanthranilate isomerase
VGQVRTRIKVCCLASRAEAAAAVAAGADAIGFVGVRPPTPRTIDDALVAEIVAATPPPVATFLLTAERTAEAIAAQVRRCGVGTVQMVAEIAPDEARRLADLAPHVRLVKVVHVGGPEALELIPAYAAHVHAFLLDSGRPNAATPEYGGTGRHHDWTISAAFVKASPSPVFLAGGLTAGNVGEAIRRVRPFGVDLCSGVRSEGRLDPIKLAEFVRAVRAADEASEG